MSIVKFRNEYTPVAGSALGHGGAMPYLKNNKKYGILL